MSTACSNRVGERDGGVRTMSDGTDGAAVSRVIKKVVELMKTCLVVDDSSVIRKVARRILEGLDFKIIEAEDGEQALEQCRSRCPTRCCSTGTCR